MRQNFFLIISICVLSSCETNWGRYGGYRIEYESEVEYYLVLDKVDTTLSNYPYYNKGTFLKYYYTDSIVDTVFVAEGGEVIDSYVDPESISFNDKYIVLKQKPLNIICECNDSCSSIAVKNFNNSRTYDNCKEALSKSKYYQFWIIDKLESKVFGPFDRKKYELKRKELHIPSEVSLKEE